jgi:hypothetical protein
MLADFLLSVAQKYGAESMGGAVVLVSLKRPIDDLIREAEALGPYHRGARSNWSHCFLLGDAYSGPQTPILDCTIRDDKSQILWDTNLQEFLSLLTKPSGGIYAGKVADYNDPRVHPLGVKLIPTLTGAQRAAVVRAGQNLAEQGYRYDLPGLFRELARFISGISLPAGQKLLFCSAFVQASYRAALGDLGDFMPPSLASTDVTPDDIWYSTLGVKEFARAPVLARMDSAAAPVLRKSERPAGLIVPTTTGARVNSIASLSGPAVAGPIDMRSGIAPIAEIDRAIAIIEARPQLYNSAAMLQMLRSARADIAATVAKMPSGANPDSFFASIILSALGGSRPIVEPKSVPLDDIVGWVQYEDLDIGWISSFIDYLSTSRDPFPTHLDSLHGSVNPVIQVTDDEVKIAIAGDWGTRNESSARIGQNILANKPDITIHLGDVYYAGEIDQERQFVSDWPAGANSKYPAFALNSNHEMYSGGQGYFRVALQSAKFSAQQRLSYFALELPKWVIVGLDSAYNAPHKVWQLYQTGNLNQVQIDWIRGVAANARASGKKIIALTHHHGLDVSGVMVPNFFDQMIDAFTVDAARRGPDYWYWGHVHGVLVFTPIQIPKQQVVLHPRCVGHGGVPYREFSSLAPETLEWWETQHAPEPESERLLNGFVLLTIKGDSLSEAFIDEFGHQRWPRS